MQMLQESPTVQNDLTFSAPFFAINLPTVDASQAHLTSPASHYKPATGLAGGSQLSPPTSQYDSASGLVGGSPLNGLSQSPQDVMYSSAPIQFETSLLDQNSDDDSPVSIPSKRGISRPCKRCVALGKEDSCHDIAHKKRGRPKLRDKASMMQGHFLANERKYEIMYDAIQNPAFAANAQRASPSQRPQLTPQPHQTGRIAFVHQTIQEFHEQQQQQQREEEQIHERIIPRSFNRSNSVSSEKKSLTPQPDANLQQPQPLKNDHTPYLSSIDFNILADDPESSMLQLSPIQSTNSFLSLTSALSPTLPDVQQQQQQQPRDNHALQVTIFMSMEVCCARASDEVNDSWGYYPQELAHRSFYDFVSAKDTDRLAQLHRLLLDNVQSIAEQHVPVQNRPPRLPRTERTTSDLFYDTSPDKLLTPAQGSNTYSDTVHIKRRDGELELYSMKVYLGGGFGADLLNPDTYSKLYIVAIMDKYQYAVNNGSNSNFEAPARSNFSEGRDDSPMACDSPQPPTTTTTTTMDTTEVKSGILKGSGDGDRFQAFRPLSSSSSSSNSSSFPGSSSGPGSGDSRLSKSPPRPINYLNSATPSNQPPVSPKINIAPTTTGTNNGMLMGSSNRFFPKTGNNHGSSSASTSFRTMSLNPITGNLPNAAFFTRRNDSFSSPSNRFAPTAPVARASTYTHPTTQYFLQTSSSTLNAAASAAQTKTRGSGYSFTPMTSVRGAADDLAPNDRATGKTESNPKMEMSITSLLC
ncbi:hypothetical protein INT43_006553 [Umbelopsis isabellina]|uniref:Uncharacterized protein n=1 Tax=Mortierella isabellina TaxID=91625 RepID=A0A8H7UJ15_MORIS|nr:hypothetical protein INT43_006553 [Umbelopsis isabellina]